MKKNIIINLLLDKNIIPQNEVEIYEFGIECIIFKAFNYFIYILIGFFLKMLIELFFLSVPFIMLRKSAGGFHAKTKTRCFFFSIFCEVAALLLIRCGISVLFGIIILGVSDIVIVKLAPIDNEAKRMCLDEKEYYAKLSRKRAIIFTILSLGMLSLEAKRYFLSMVVGIFLSALLLMTGKLGGLHQTGGCK